MAILEDANQMPTTALATSTTGFVGEPLPQDLGLIKKCNVTLFVMIVWHASIVCHDRLLDSRPACMHIRGSSYNKLLAIVHFLHGHAVFLSIAYMNSEKNKNNQATETQVVQL